MGLKFPDPSEGGWCRGALKSDQNGIEIESLYRLRFHVVSLKSDQNGIEMTSLGQRVAQLHLLKSDQNGIEIYEGG